MAIKEPTRAEWLELRKTGIGGSDVAAIFGLSPWKSPMELFAEKTGQMPEKKQTWAMTRGIALEEPLARWFSETYGVKVWRKNGLIRHPEHTWMVANIDRRVVGQKIGVECKTASPFAFEKWANGDAPIDYVMQCQHYMAVTGWDAWWLVYVIDGHEPQAILIQRDEEAIQTIIYRTREFWFNHVMKKIPPNADESDSCRNALSAMYATPTYQSAVELPEEAEFWIQEKHQASAEEKAAKERGDLAKNTLRAMMGDNEIGFRNGQVAVTWKLGKKGRTLLVKGGADSE